tara:strand:- start:5236 stop:6660 length:1425 start_codon:yes stop_codon:yes gene_type:complete
MNIIQKPKIYNILEELDKNDILYVCWKDMDLFEDVLVGKKDLDILILNKDRQKIIALAEKVGFLELKNSFEVSDNLMHLYLADGASIVYHIHIYFQLITGESWLKEFHIPIEDELLRDRVWNEPYQLWVLPDDLAQELLILRHFLKTTSLVSSFVYKKKRAKAQQYLSVLNNQLSENIFRNIAFYLGDDSIELRACELNVPNYFTAIKIRRKMSKYKRLNKLNIIKNRYHHLFLRIQKKYLLKEKKIFLNDGIILAFTGVDGSGKSSLIEHTESFYSRFLTTKKLHMGRPYPTFVNSIWRILKSKKIKEQSNISKLSTPIWKCVFAYILVKIRLKRACYAKKLAKKGYLVLVDRWPTWELGKMDGPRIKFHSKSNFLVRLLGEREREIYQNFKMADICIILKVSSSHALERNHDRVKVNKETQDEILERFETNNVFNPRAHNVIEFDNSIELEHAEISIISQSWIAMSKLIKGC